MIKYLDLIVEEKDVTEVKNIIDSEFNSLFDTLFVADLAVKHCGWAEEPTKWFIAGYVFKKKYNRIIEKLLDNNYTITISKGSGPHITGNLYLEKKIKELESEKETKS